MFTCSHCSSFYMHQLTISYSVYSDVIFTLCFSNHVLTLSCHFFLNKYLLVYLQFPFLTESANRGWKMHFILPEKLWLFLEIKYLIFDWSLRSQLIFFSCLLCQPCTCLLGSAFDYFHVLSSFILACPPRFAHGGCTANSFNTVTQTKLNR